MLNGARETKKMLDALNDIQKRAKPMTNADRIWAMSVEELADFLTEEKWRCDNYRVCRECPRYIGDCCLPLGEWLQQPVEEVSQ